MKAWLLALLNRRVVRQRTFVADVEWHRSEELRPDRLGPSEDDLAESDSAWRPPKDAARDPWRPKNTLGPL